VVEIQLVGCPDPDPCYVRFLNPQRNALSTDLDTIGRAYIGALAREVETWLREIPEGEPIGVCFSGGIDSGAAFLVTYHTMLRLGMNPARLKAFTLAMGDAPDLAQAREFLERLDLALFHEPIEIEAALPDLDECIRLLEDYKPLDVECAAMDLALCRGIRAQHPDWRYLIDGDGGDENLKDYPVEENAELTIHSVINNPLLYHEGWGVGRIKHSLTYSGGLSRSCVRTYAPARHCGFMGFSPFMQPAVIETSEAIPFAELTGYNLERLYALKGEIVARGVKAITGLEMPVFAKRRFQHGAAEGTVSGRFTADGMAAREADYRRRFLALYS
jgi:asparagine synthase (glutamine-hydrolysing)